MKSPQAGGKGSDRRPQAVSDEEMADRWNTIFKKKKKKKSSIPRKDIARPNGN